MVNTSVTREHLEPSVAVGVHAGIGLGPQAMNFDIANACLGFVNGMTLAANMIDAGQIEYALIVAGEDASRVQDATLRRLNRPEITREEYQRIRVPDAGLGCRCRRPRPRRQTPGRPPHPRRHHPGRHPASRTVRR